MPAPGEPEGEGNGADARERLREQALRDSEARYRGLFETSPIAIALRDYSRVKARLAELSAGGAGDLTSYLEAHPEVVRECAGLTRLIDVNPAYLELYEAESAEQLPPGLERFDEEGLEALARGLVALAAGVTRFETDAVIRTATGARRHVRARVAAAPGHGRTLSRVWFSLLDLSGEARALEELRESEERYRSLFEDAPNAIAVADWSAVKRRVEELRGEEVKDFAAHLAEHPEVVTECAGLIEAVAQNPAFLELFEASSEKEIADDITRTMEEEGYRAIADVVVAIAEGRTRVESVVWARTMTGERRRIAWTWLVAPGHEQTLSRAWHLPVDVTAQAEAEDRLAFLAYHDSLTGLANRALFEEHLNQALARARRHGTELAVLYLDLDRLKAVNDGLGHAAGDELLRQVAARLSDAVRAEDLVARHSGDEFLVLLDLGAPDPGRSGGDGAPTPKVAADRIHRALRASFPLEGEEISIDASIGISLFPGDAESAETLVRNADEAMYRSKQRGRGGTSLFAEEDPDQKLQVSGTARLRKALERGEFEVHYQPIVELAGGGCERVEALIRWRDPERGVVPAGEFIPLAEETGMIEPLGEWVVGEVCRQLGSWRRQGVALGASVNLSLRELRRDDLVATLRGAIRSAELPPGALMVEITESSAMRDPGRVNEVIRELTGDGVAIAIDDFGAGYSSLSRLREIEEAKMLKIDRSFIRNLPGDRTSAGLVSGIIEICHALALSPLAEGIETADQRAFLLGCGCELGQGFHFSPALEADRVVGWLANPVERQQVG